MRRLSFLIGLVLTAVLLTGCKSSQPISAEKQAQIASISSKVSHFDFDFIPTMIRPTHGRSLQLTGGYSLELTPNQIRAYMPYIGRAYVVPSNPMSIGLDFKSKQFEYSNIQNSNGSYTIRIAPRDLHNLEDKGMQMTLQISPTGSATLNIQFLNRQSISYSGYID